MPRRIDLDWRTKPDIPYPLYESIPFTWEGLGLNDNSDNNKIAGEFERIFGLAHEGPVTPLQYYDVDNARNVEHNQVRRRLLEDEMFASILRTDRKRISSPVGAVQEALRIFKTARDSINYPLPEDYFERRMLEWPGRFEYLGQLDSSPSPV